MEKVYGPYLRTDGRKHVIIYNSETGSRKTVSYPKFLLEQHLGRKLAEDETTDHINGDFTDDRIENLRVISRAENSAQASPPKETVELTCIVCGMEFAREARHERRRIKDGMGGPYCSKSCSTKDWYTNFMKNKPA